MKCDWSAANLEEFSPISSSDLLHLKRSARDASRKGGAVGASFGGIGLGDIAAVPGPFMKHPRGIRDVTE
jgi:hypothetical protein